ncbi:hypothetical protein LguiB_020505 [Lonicera macranthoides]
MLDYLPPELWVEILTRYRYHGPIQHFLGFGFNPMTNDYNAIRVVYLLDYGLWCVPKFPPKVEIYELSTEYGMENSWTKQFKINLTPAYLRSHGQLRGPFSFRKNGAVFLVESTDSGDLVSYNPERRQVKKLRIRGSAGSFYINTYMEIEPSPN